VLALTMLFGGVDLLTLAVGYGIAGLTAVGLGAYSLYLGVVKDSLRDALVWAYGVMFGSLGVVLFCCCFGGIPGWFGLNPFTALGWSLVAVNEPGMELHFWANLGTFLAVSLVSAVVFTVRAVGRVRGAVTRRRKPMKSRPVLAKTVAPPPAAALAKTRDADRDAPTDDWGEAVGPVRRTRRTFYVPGLRDGDPFLWKERHFGGRLGLTERGIVSGCGITVISVVLFVLGSILFVGVATQLEQGRWIGSAVNPVARFVLAAAGPVLGLALAVRAATGVTREREKQTLDALLTVPVSRSRLLWAKLIAPVYWLRWGLISVAGAAVGALLTGGVHPVGWVICVVLVAGFLAFAAALGLALSTFARTTARATVYVLVALFAVWLAPVLAGPLAGVIDPDAESAMYQLSQPVGVWQNAFDWEGRAERAARDLDWWAMRVVGLVTGVLYAVAAGAVWLAAVRRFEAEGR
jgi:hypothetical protein